VEQTPRDPEAGAVERLLAQSKPVPSPAFRAELERRLFASDRLPARRWLRVPRPAVAGAAAVAGLAAAFAALALAGTGPLSTDGADDVRAKDACRYVTVLGSTRNPYIVELADGSLDVRFHRERGERLVKRCR
jgi:hypothetical protein